MTIPEVIALHPERIPADQRAALAWSLRNALEVSDQRGAAWHLSATPALGELARIECLRGELLALIAALEGDGRLRAGLVESRAGGSS